MLNENEVNKILEGSIDDEIRRLLNESGVKQVLTDSTQNDVGDGRVSSGSEVVAESYVARAKPFEIPTESLSEKTKRAHKELYTGYVEALNRVSAELDTADRKNLTENGSEFRSLKYDEMFNMNAVYLHELYFANIGDPHSEIAMDSLPFMRLERDFGSFDRWQYDFLACCMSADEGWAMTVYSTFLRKYINIFITSHVTNIPVGCYPVIVMDVHSHSYFHDYLNNRAGYARQMMQEINWRVIEERFGRAELINKALEA